jgi:hypothetical protein
MASGTIKTNQVKTVSGTVTVTAGNEGYVSLDTFGIPNNSIIVGAWVKNSDWIHVRLYSNNQKTNCRLTKYNSDTTPTAGNYNLTVAYIEV